MTIEQRIINVAEKQNYYDSRELRAIALEVRKMEDRIKQLEEMYEGEPGERPDLLGSNVMGLLKRELNSAQQRIKRLEEAVEAYRTAYTPDGHVAPHDCFATGPTTGNPIEDLVACPGCWAERKAKEAK